MHKYQNKSALAKVMEKVIQVPKGAESDGEQNVVK